MDDGFQDATGTFPRRQTQNQSGVNPRARSNASEEIQSAGNRSARVASTTPQIAAEAVTEPTSSGSPQYPHNQVYETRGGHIVEYDDTPGRERVSIQHKTGTKVEMRPDGSVLIKSKGDKYEIVAGDADTVVRGNVNIIVESNASIRCKGDMNLQTDGDFNHLVQGNYNLEVQGSVKHRIHGNEETSTTGSRLHETRGNVIERHLSNYHERIVGNYTVEIGGNQNFTTEGEVAHMAYGAINASYYGGTVTLNGENADGNTGAGTFQTAAIDNTATFDGVVARVGTSLDVTGPTTTQTLDATSAVITTTQGNLVGQATYSVNAADLMSSITTLRGLSLPSLSSLAGGLGANILNNIGVGTLGNLQGQLSSITNSVRGGIMGSINGAYSSIGGLFTEMQGITNVSDLTGSIQGFGFDYDLNLNAGELASLGGLETTLQGITDITDTSWHVNTAQYHEYLSGINSNTEAQQAVAAARAALEEATNQGITDATVAASSAFATYTSLSSIEGDVSGFITSLGSLDANVQAAAQNAINSTATQLGGALTASSFGTVAAPGDILPVSSVSSPAIPAPPATGPDTVTEVTDVTGTSDDYITNLDRQPVTGYNSRLLNTYEVVARARNRSLRTNQAWLQDQLDNGAILSTISSSTPPTATREGSTVSSTSGSNSIGNSRAGQSTYQLVQTENLRVNEIPTAMILTEGIGKSSKLSPNFMLSHMLAGDSLSSVLKDQAGLSAVQIAQNAQLVSYNVLEELRNKYRDTWTVSEGIYNLLPNEKVDSNSLTVDMVKGLGVGIQFPNHPNSFYFEAAQWIRNHLTFDKLVLSYIDYDPSGVNEPTLIVTIKPGANSRTVYTEFNHVKVDDNILDLYNAEL